MLLLQSYFDSHNCYTSLHSNQELDDKRYRRIFFEFDESDMFVAAQKAFKVWDKLSLHGLYPDVYFTGGRSYHFYLQHPTYQDDGGLYKAKVNEFVRRLKLDFLDMAVVGDYRRLTRLPGTRHKKTGMWCVDIPAHIFLKSPKVLMAEARRRSVECIMQFPARTDNPLLLEILDNIDVQNGKPMKAEPREVLKHPRCITYLMERLKETGELSHQARIHLGAYLLRTGKTVNEILDIFKDANDYRERLTRYQLVRLRERNFYCLACDRAKRRRVCPIGDLKCEYYPSINRFVGDVECKIGKN